MQLIREMPISACEVMIDLGNCEWVTAFVIGPRAWILPPDKRATVILLENRSKRKEVDLFLSDAYGVSTVFYPCTRDGR